MSEQTEFEKFVPSPFEERFERLCAKLEPFVPEGITPNQITLFGFGAGLFAGLAFYLASFNKNWLLAGILGVLLHIVADDLDGAVARTRNLKSQSGYFLDQFTDTTTMIVIFLGLGYSSYASAGLVLLPAILYPYHLFVMLHWIHLKKRWPFPLFGPFELQAALIILSLFTYIWNKSLFSLWEHPLGFFDLTALVVAPLSFFEVFKSAYTLYQELNSSAGEA